MKGNFVHKDIESIRLRSIMQNGTATNRQLIVIALLAATN